MGSGALAMMIPPSALGVLLCAIGRISVGKFLFAIIVPGVILAVLYALYIVIRCFLDPTLAPTYELDSTTYSEKIILSLKYLLPLGIIIFLTISLIFFGISTPSEAASIGCLAACILGVIIGGIGWVKEAILSTLRVTAMAGVIVMGAGAFSQILAFSGASRGMLETVINLPVPPILIIAFMQFMLIILGGPMDEISLMMISIPVYLPIVNALGFDPIWFAVMILLNVEIALLSPPFGMVLFVMKGVSMEGITMGDIFRSAIPFLILQTITLALVLFFPQLALWLPNLMH
jgi:tripartite ATP-independent transporter DctM subunit